jgi:membrane fusion protein
VRFGDDPHAAGVPLTKLFRDEAMSTQRDSFLGTVRLVQPTPSWLATLAAALIAGALIAYGCVGTYTRKAHVAGVLVPQGGGVNLTAPVSGRVAEIRATEGSSVGDGEVLFVIDTEHTILSKLGDRTEVRESADAISEKIGLRRAGLVAERQLRTGQAGIRRTSLRRRLQHLSEEIARLDDEIALQVRRRQLAEKSLRRYEDLIAAGFVSSAQVQGQQEALIDQSSRSRSLERMRLNLQREHAELVAEDAQVEGDLANALATIDANIAALEQEAIETASRRTSLVLAPKAGTVTAVGVGAGQWVNAGQTLAALHPQGVPLEADLYATSRVSGFVEAGQPVRLRIAAFPYQKFGFQAGQVVEVSGSAFALSDLPVAISRAPAGSQGTEALYKIRVALDRAHIEAYGTPRPLKAGMVVDADILQDRRAIIEWLFEPLIAAGKRM